jgi:2-succinyl-6-hydroxy-2,4-cyclohexadiene-1-carboxylate synthase
MSRMAVNGIRLNVEVSGDEGPTLLLLHGFTGSSETWQPFLRSWDRFRIVRVDVIGHGLSDAPDDPDRYSMTRAVADVFGVLDRLDIQRLALLGYSMGGRLALHLALAAPERFSTLVLESASPGIEDEAERMARVAADEALADSIDRDGLESFVDRWQAQPLFTSQAALPEDVKQRQRSQRLAGSPLGLANSLRGMGAGRQDYLLPRLGALTMPTLLLVGALDTKYVALGRQLSSILPNAELQVIEHTGHAAHLEREIIFAIQVGEFLATTVYSPFDRRPGG